MRSINLNLHQYWLEQPSMYHYRRRLFANRHHKMRYLKAMVQAAQAYHGIGDPHYPTNK